MKCSRLDVRLFSLVSFSSRLVEVKQGSKRAREREDENGKKEKTSLERELLCAVWYPSADSTPGIFSVVVAKPLGPVAHPSCSRTNVKCLCPSETSGVC